MKNIAGWRSWSAQEAHNLQVVGSSPAPATWAVAFPSLLVQLDRMTVITDRYGFESRIGSKFCNSDNTAILI